LLFVAFAQWGYLLFGQDLNGFKTMYDAVFSLFRIILGDFNFPEMEEADRVWGPIFFILYIFVIFFILINMFLAIIADAYTEVKEGLAEIEEEYGIGDYLKNGYQNMIKRLTFKREKIVDIRKALKEADANEDNVLEFEEWRQDLKKKGHADAEIEAVFAKYDIDGDRILSEEEMKRMQDDLDGQEAALMEDIEELERAMSDAEGLRSTVTLNDEEDEEEEDEEDEEEDEPRYIPSEEFAILTRRVDRVEHSIGNIVSKIDSVLNKLDIMDKRKIQKKDVITRLLDNISKQDAEETVQVHGEEEKEKVDAAE